MKRRRNWLMISLIVLCVVSVGLNMIELTSRQRFNESLVESYQNQLLSAKNALHNGLTRTKASENQTFVATAIGHLLTANQTAVLLGNCEAKYSIDRTRVYIAIPFELRMVLQAAQDAPNREERMKRAIVAFDIYTTHLSIDTIRDPNKMIEAYSKISSDLAQAGFTRDNTGNENTVPEIGLT